MGVDCKISLPQEAQVQYVAEVIGILLGKKSVLNEHKDSQRPYLSVDVEGVEVKGNETMPECCHIYIKNTAQGDRSFLYHFEGSKGTSKDNQHSTGQGRGLMPRATPENIAMGIGLVKFFGGEIYFSDSDSSDCDFKRPLRRDITACDGDAWAKFQRRIANLKPLTWEDIMSCEELATYPMRDTENLEYLSRKVLFEQSKLKKGNRK